jgi:hypothetical protein
VVSVGAERRMGGGRGQTARGGGSGRCYRAASVRGKAMDAAAAVRERVESQSRGVVKAGVLWHGLGSSTTAGDGHGSAADQCGLGSVR